MQGGLGCLLRAGDVVTQKCVLWKWEGSGGLNENLFVFCCCMGLMSSWINLSLRYQKL